MKKALSLLLLVWSAFALAQGQMNPAFAQATSARGTQSIKLTVDATEVPRKLFHAQLVIPAAPGPLTLLYPQWIPGEHGPTGPIINLAGLKMTAGGKTLSWRRDDVDMYAFHVEVPAGAKEIEVALDYLAPTFAGGFSAGSSTTSHLAIVTWNQLIMYPQGSKSDDITYAASLRLPDGWKFGTSLAVAKQGRDQESAAKPGTLDELDRYFAVVLSRARRFHEALDATTDEVTRPLSPVALFAFGGDCTETLAAPVIRRDLKTGDWLTLFAPRAYRTPDKRRISRKEATRAMYEPGDGRVTRASLLGQDIGGGRNSIFYNTSLPIAYSVFTCDAHSDLQSNKILQDNALTLLVSELVK